MGRLVVVSMWRGYEASTNQVRGYAAFDPAWLDGLTATKWAYDIASKKRIVEPDHKLRVEAASKLAAYLEGMPGQTLIVKTPRGSGSGGRLVGDDQEVAFDAAMTASPALREAVRKRLERAERAAVK